MNASHEALVLTRPPDEFSYDGILSLRAAARTMAGERMPLPEEVAETPVAWEQEVMRQIQRIRFEVDYNKRPQHLQ